MRRPLGSLPCALLLVWLLPQGPQPSLVMASPAGVAATGEASFEIMRRALQQALHLQFAPALETARGLETTPAHPLAAPLTSGMIAYFQWRWQMSATDAAREQGQTSLSAVLKEAQKSSARPVDDAEQLLFLGLAAVFKALLLQHDTWSSLPLFLQGQTWLQQALIAQEATSDAHLGLGLQYFAGMHLPAWLRHLWGSLGGQGPEESIRHLQRAVASGHFSGDVARTFLVRIYEAEKRFPEAIALGQELQSAFPENGNYRLLIGRSQCAASQYPLCAATLGGLAASLEAAGTSLGRRDDRHDLYYFWGRALDETAQYDQAFQAFRRAINEDPRTLKDATLWAKYYLARLYERREAAKTAEQIYRQLLRSRNVADLHQQVKHRLTRLR